MKKLLDNYWQSFTTIVTVHTADNTNELKWPLTQRWLASTNRVEHHPITPSQPNRTSPHPLQTDPNCMLPHCNPCLNTHLITSSQLNITTFTYPIPTALYLIHSKSIPITAYASAPTTFHNTLHPTHVKPIPITHNPHYIAAHPVETDPRCMPPNPLLHTHPITESQSNSTTRFSPNPH